MTKTKKDIDCIAVKRKGAEAVRARLKDKTREERLEYWTERTRVLRERQSQSSGSASPSRQSN
jgi:hypothetical protein